MQKGHKGMTGPCGWGELPKGVALAGEMMSGHSGAFKLGVSRSGARVEGGYEMSKEESAMRCELERQ